MQYLPLEKVSFVCAFVVTGCVLWCFDNNARVAHLTTPNYAENFDPNDLGALFGGAVLLSQEETAVPRGGVRKRSEGNHRGTLNMSVLTCDIGLSLL